MKFGLKILAFLIGLLAGGQAAAVPLTFGFDAFGAPVPPGGGGAAAPNQPVTFSNPNHGTYGLFVPRIVLGDDGWDSEIAFDANAGVRFDAVSINIVGGFQNVFTSPVSAAAFLFDPYAQLSLAQTNGTLSQHIYPNLNFSGYRDGALVAFQEVTYTGALSDPVVFGFSSAFSDLDRLELALDFSHAVGYWPVIEGNTLYSCPQGRCGLVELDDLVLDVAAGTPGSGGEPANVPLPGGGVLLALGLLGLLRARR